MRFDDSLAFAALRTISSRSAVVDSPPTCSKPACCFVKRYARRAGPPRIAHKQAERWAAGLIKMVRDGALNPAPETALRVIALHHNLDGNLLPAEGRRG